MPSEGDGSQGSESSLASRSTTRAWQWRQGPLPRTIAERYHLGELLGRGGHGEVWEAEDRLAGERVAVKLLDGELGPQAARVRREIAALRLLRLPGVVRLHDEGLEGGLAFLVMERVSGQPFPGVTAPRPWAEIAGVTAALLETLARVHAAGVVHRDLKPANVLVSAQGQVTLLDFGISLFGSRLEDPLEGEGEVPGTPHYLAPEQIRGDPVTPRADLYAVGVMLYAALSGRFPHAADSWMALMRAQLTQPVTPLAEAAPCVPASVAALVERLLAREPEERPESALEALRALRGEPEIRPGALALLELAGGAALVEEDLRELFVGPDRLLYLREDAARMLRARTEGAPARVAAEVAAWVRAGLARWDGGRLSIDRDAIDRLEAELCGETPGGDPREARPEVGLLHALAAGAEPRQIAMEAAATARVLARDGHLGRAVAALEEGLHAVRRGAHARGEGEVPLLSMWLDIALSRWMPRSLDRVLYELHRAEAPPEAIAPLVHLARAGLALGTDAHRALRLADELPELDDPVLECRRQGVRMIAARSSSLECEEAMLSSVTDWAKRSKDPTALARLAGWTGRVRYRQGLFEEAAALHTRAAAEEPWTVDRIAARLNASSALLEAFRHEEARASAMEALTLAKRSRHAFFAARAEWVIRTALYRMATTRGPDLELVDAVALLGLADVEALVCTTEAGAAFRAGQLDMALELADRARRLWVGNGLHPEAVLLLRCLALRCGAPAREGEMEALSESASSCLVPGIGIQALALLAPRAMSPPHRRKVAALISQIERRYWGLRMDVLSVEESLEALGLDPDVGDITEPDSTR